jgi:hypothetical protein
MKPETFKALAADHRSHFYKYDQIDAVPSAFMRTWVANDLKFKAGGRGRYPKVDFAAINWRIINEHPEVIAELKRRGV